MNKANFVVAGATTLVTIATVSGTAFAWHPQGAITKTVFDVTSDTTTPSDANDEASAVTAKTGDTLTYTVTVSNNGLAAANGDDDMANTVMTDTLPDGIALVSDASQRTITENLGTITPGKSVSKTYNVKVTSTTDGDVITNKACFTGNSIVNDNPQSGCDVAVIKVSVPAAPAPVTPTPTTPTPTTTTPAGGVGADTTTATALPNTGASTFLAPMIGIVVAAAAYTGRIKFLARANA